MACIISLIDPTKNKAVETRKVNENYLITEKRVKELNEKLNKKKNPKSLYWTVTVINV
jgi:hypothetical protein